MEGGTQGSRQVPSNIPAVELQQGKEFLGYFSGMGLGCLQPPENSDQALQDPLWWAGLGGITQT